MNPGTTTVDPLASSGPSTLRARRAVRARSGAAAPYCASVAMISTASTNAARRLALEIAAARHAAARRSPREASRSLARGSRWPSTAAAPHSSRYSRAAASTLASSRRRAAPGAIRPLTICRWRRRSSAAIRPGAFVRPAAAWRAPSRSRSVTPANADATTTSGPECAATSATALRMAFASASDAPPNFQTCSVRFTSANPRGRRQRRQTIERLADRGVVVRQLDRRIGVARREPGDPMRVVRRLEFREFQAVRGGNDDDPVGLPDLATERSASRAPRARRRCGDR